MELDAPSSFDPYHKWLGIPPAEQPPHHYRLLGIAAFESDREVIAAAADRQMAHVKSFSTGKYAAASQTLLNELSKARVALLNVALKAAYDQRLQAPRQQGANARPKSGAAERRDVTEELALSADALPMASVRATSGGGASRQFQRRRQNESGLQWLLVAGGVALIAVLMFYAATNRPAAPSVATVVAKPTPPNEPRMRAPERFQPPPRSAPQQQNPALVPVPNDGIEPPAEIKPRAIEKPPAAAPHRAPESISQAVHEVDLDLSDRVQRLTLPAKDDAEYHVLGLRDCKFPCTVEPSAGKLSPERKVTVTVNGPRVAVWTLSMRPRSADQTLIEAEGVIVTDDKERLPLTLTNIGRVCRQLMRQHHQAATLLESGQMEQARLQSWLDGPGTKPLAEVGPARARVRALTQSIPEQAQIVQSLAADLRVAEDVQAFAEHLDEKCMLEIAEERRE